jgi:AbiEi antitoxin C-terminal domain
MNLTNEVTVVHPRRRRKLERRIPGWASALLARLAQDSPDVVTRDDVSAYLIEVKSPRGVDRTIEELSRLGWLAPIHLKGVWAYLPPGEDEVIDRYIDLRALRARDPQAIFALAGEAAAWHLGYIDREFDGPVAVWLPIGTRLPFGLRPHVSIVTLGWSANTVARLGPTANLLNKRRLDLTRWAAGLPAFGPEALMVQLASRPGSFRAWPDLVPHLDDIVADISTDRLKELLVGQSSSAWQRAAYLVHLAHRPVDAMGILDGRPNSSMPTVQFGKGGEAVWVGEYRIVDRLIAPLQQTLGKA